MADMWNLRKRPPNFSKSEKEIKDSTISDAERAHRYRQKIRKDSKRYEEYKIKESERKKRQRQERTKEQILVDNMKSKERQKRYRERQKAKGLKPNTSNCTKVLTRKERENQREYWKIKKRESRANLTSQKKRRIKEKDRKYFHENKQKSDTKSKYFRQKKSVHVSRLEHYHNTLNCDFVKSTAPLMQELTKDKVIKKKLINKFSFLKKYGLGKLFSKYTGIRESDISKGAELSNKRKRRRDATSPEIVKNITEFMHRPDQSTNLPVAKRIKSNHQERRVLDKPLKKVFDDFKYANPTMQISLSTFKRHRPTNIETIRKQHWEGCLCEMCTNIDLKISALNQLGARRRSPVNLKDKCHAIEITMCEKNSKYNNKECIRRECNECGVDNIVRHLQPFVVKCENEDITYTKWERVKKNVRGKDVTRTMPVTKTQSLTELIIEISKDLAPLAEHLFVANWQQSQFTTLRKSIPEGWLLLNMDFAENYSCVGQNEVQAAHWGHAQVTVHPSVAYYKCLDEDCDEVVIESLIFISNDKTHDAHAVHSFTERAHQHLTEQRGLLIRKEIQMTDGCAAQYKSKTPFADISCGFLDHGFCIERHFYGSRHGKGPSDGAGAVVKSYVKRAVLGNNAIVNNAEDFYQIAKGLAKNEKHSKRSLFLVNDIKRARPDRSNKRTVVGTRKIQCIRSIHKDKLASRNLSCFCSPCLKEETTECENKAYVDKWKTVELETVGKHNRRIATRGRTRVRSRGGRGQRGTRPQGKIRTRGGRGRGRNRCRQIEDSSSDEDSSNEASSSDTDDSSDQVENSSLDEDSSDEDSTHYVQNSTSDNDSCSTHEETSLKSLDTKHDVVPNDFVPFASIPLPGDTFDVEDVDVNSNTDVSLNDSLVSHILDLLVNPNDDISQPSSTEMGIAEPDLTITEPALLPSNEATIGKPVCGQEHTDPEMALAVLLEPGPYSDTCLMAPEILNVNPNDDISQPSSTEMGIAEPDLTITEPALLPSNEATLGKPVCGQEHTDPEKALAVLLEPGPYSDTCLMAPEILNVNPNDDISQPSSTEMGIAEPDLTITEPALLPSNEATLGKPVCGQEHTDPEMALAVLLEPGPYSDTCLMAPEILNVNPNDDISQPSSTEMGIAEPDLTITEPALLPSNEATLGKPVCGQEHTDPEMALAVLLEPGPYSHYISDACLMAPEILNVNPNDDISQSSSTEMGIAEPALTITEPEMVITETGAHTDIMEPENPEYNIGDYVLINHGKSTIPAVVVQAPSERHGNVPNGLWIQYFGQAKRSRWSLLEKPFFCFSTDIIQKISDPTLSAVGSRLYYNFEF